MTNSTDCQTPPRRDEVEEARRKVQRLTDDFRPVRGLLDMSENESIIVALLVAAGTLASALSAAEGAVKRLGALEAYLATTEDVHLLTFGADVVTIEVGGASPLWPTVRRTGPHALRDALDGLAAMPLPEAKPIQGRTLPRDLFAGMNKTEKAFAITLEARKRDGLIHDWKYEAVTFKLADDCRYTPDFMVIETDGVLGFDETKGFWRDDAKVKIRVAAKLFPFRFTAHRLEKSQWHTEEF